MTKLEIIDASSNNILFIQKAEFRNMTSLTGIDLKGNKLEYLDFNLIQGCSNLKKLCLFGNLFPQTFSLSYSGLPNLDQDLM